MLTNLVADKSFLQVFLVLGKVLLELFVVLRVEAALLQAAGSPRGNISFPSLDIKKAKYIFVEDQVMDQAIDLVRPRLK